MLVFSETGFGYIVINGNKYDYDVVVYPNGIIRRRRKDLSAKYRGMYNHTPLSREELEYYLREINWDIDYIVVGTGQYGALPFTREARELVEELKVKGIAVVIDKTPNVLSILNKLCSGRGKVLGILHVTC